MSFSSGTTSAASLPSSEPAIGARVGSLIFRSRDWLFPLVLLTLAFGTRPRMTGGLTTVDHVADAAGALVSMIGQVLRVLVIGLVYITRGGQNRRVWASALVDDGMFGHCRNPLYLANLLLILGLAMVHNGVAMYLIGVPFFAAAYFCMVRAEEHYLRQRFGAAYVDYCRRVPRWVPSFHGLSRTLRKTRFDWTRVLRKEYGTPFAWVSGLLVLLVWEHAVPGASPIGRFELRAIVTTWVVFAILYVVVRTLKLRGRLGDA
jgi:protein-S-isoprenylcysteine O-methyltransferase Ste14